MSFKIVENLTPKEKERRRVEYTAWLEEHGYSLQKSEEDKMTEAYANWTHDASYLRSQPSDKPLLQARSLTQELIRDLQSINHDTQAALKLAANIQEILNTIK
jgi:hypothetical protein